MRTSERAALQMAEDWAQQEQARVGVYTITIAVEAGAVTGMLVVDETTANLGAVEEQLRGEPRAVVAEHFCTYRPLSPVEGAR